ncbi:MAG: hypothetical protein DRQ56_09500 [Gammaproteobacteria bacterium]|nr:MAG: hypothetical protein DRQ56_09500 [Gammaproteobacteria bacterium]
MNEQTNDRRSTLLPVFGLVLLALLLSALWLAVVPGVSAEEAAATQDLTFDNLVRVKDPKVAMAFFDPEADFSVFKRVAILEPMVSFRSNWQRDQNRSRSRNISARDMERIKADVATLFERVFTERLEAAGYEIVEVTGDDVMVVRPAIIDLDITAPDTRSAGRSYSFSASTGSATLYIEMFDSVSGHIIGRAADRQTVRNAGGRVTWSNSVTNGADARRMIGGWADRLVGFLQSHYK